MAYTFSWPASLPQSPQRGFSETTGTNIIRTPTDSGPAKLRYRGLKPSKMNLTFMMTDAQVQTLESWVTGTIKGVARFGFTHPRKGTTVECRLVPQGEGDLYTVTYLAPGYWTVAIQMEILP